MTTRYSIDEKQLTEPPPLHGVGNGERFARQWIHVARYVPEDRSWRVWTGDRWFQDSHKLAEDLAVRAAESILLEPKLRDLDEKDADAYKAHHKRTMTKRGIEEMLACAGWRPEMKATAAMFDADPDVLNTPTGIVDLRTGELRPHDPAAMCSRITRAAFTPGARSELWDRCIATWFPNEEMRAFVQKVLGASIAGRQTQRVALHNGRTANGKTSLLEAVVHALGDYASVVRSEIIMGGRRRDSGAATPELVVLRGIRFAWIDETPKNGMIDEGRVKVLTGGGTITGRGLHQNETTFPAQFDLHVSTNNLPSVSQGDDAIWRRLLPIPYGVVIPESQRIGNLKELLEAPDVQTAILAWLIEGYAMFLKDPTLAVVPAPVLEGMDEYKTSEDDLSRWFEECVAEDPEGRLATGDAWQSFDDWAQRNRIRTGLNDKAFRRQFMRFVRDMKDDAQAAVEAGLPDGATTDERLAHERIKRIATLNITRPRSEYVVEGLFVRAADA